MNFPKETLEGMYGTKIPFLESYNVPVIGRKFNYIPALTMDPPRVLTDPMNAYLRDRKSDQGVYNDMAKIMASGAIDSLWEDGDYNDIVKGMNADYEFNQETLNAQFKPSDVYAFMRADAERYTDETIKDFFQSQYEDKEEQKRAFLIDYGMSPAEAEQIMRQQKAEVASAALKEYIANKRPMRPMGTRIDSIARNFMRSDIPMVEANQFFDPDGNLLPGITGLGLDVGAGRTIRGGPRGRIAERARAEESAPRREQPFSISSFFSASGLPSVRARAEETIRDQAIDGLPVMSLEEAMKEQRADEFAKRQLFKRTVASLQQTTQPAVSERRALAQAREEATGKGKKKPEKAYGQMFAEASRAEGIEPKKLTQEEMRTRLITSAKAMGIHTKKGRPAGGAGGK